LRAKGAEFGATTGRPRRCGWLDAVMLREAVCVNGLTDLAINKLDILSGMGALQIATKYRIEGKLTEYFSMTLDELERAEPVYETLRGWTEDISEIRDYDALPGNTRRYIERIEQLVETPAAFISIGPGRDATISRSDLFA